MVTRWNVLVGLEVKWIEAPGGVSTVVLLLMRTVIWGAVFVMLPRKEMAVSNDWDARLWVFRGGSSMPSSFRAGLRRSRLCLLLVLSDVGAAVEELSLCWWVDRAA